MRQDRPSREGRAHTLGDLRRPGDVGARKQQDELLTAPAGGEVDVTDVLAHDERELAQHEVPGRVAVAVVHALEVVEIGEDEGERAAEALGAGQLRVQRVLRVPAVGEPCQAVHERLPLDDAVQARVLEGDDGVAGEQRRRLDVLDAEVGTREHERAEAVLPGRERELEALRSGVRVAGLDDLARRSDEQAARRAGRLDRRLDDRPQELVEVVRGREGVGEAHRRLAHTAALGLEVG